VSGHHSKGPTRTDSDVHAGEALVRENVRRIAELEDVELQKRTLGERVIDTVSSICGSRRFIYLNALFFGLWLAANLGPVEGLHFDPFPFGLLTLVVSLEAIFLSLFILITQNLQVRLAERRHHLDLQIDLLAEQENTKMLQMLAAIHERLGIEEEDEQEVAALKQTTAPEKIIEEIQRHVEKEERP
jgi:uncharacterized membrane protein